MGELKGFLKRNSPVFLLGLIVLAVFLVVILLSPKENPSYPAGFKKVEEDVFKEQESTQSNPGTNETQEYAPQVAKPENKGKPYFYGESDPNLRDAQGYPIPPQPGVMSISPEDSKYPDLVMEAKTIEQEEYSRRLQPTTITFDGANFNPSDASGYTGQKVIWTNRSSKDIEIKEVSLLQEPLRNGVKLKPGQSFEFKPLMNGRFTYIETNTLTYGTVYVNDVTTPLIK